PTSTHDYSFPPSATPPDLHSFPTRRSSDLRLLPRGVDRVDLSGKDEPPTGAQRGLDRPVRALRLAEAAEEEQIAVPRVGLEAERDRKSTRLNSSHSQISYAVFCLKKKKKKK